MGVRLCFTSPLLPDYKKMSDGIFKFSGLGAEELDEAMRFFYPLNLTEVIFTTDSIECLDLIEKNSSDLAATYVSQHETLNTNSQVPVPIISRKLFIVSGFNVTEIREKKFTHQTTAMTNFTIFDPLSYILTCLLFATLITILVMNYCMRFKFRRNRSRLSIFISFVLNKYNKMSKRMRFARLMITLLGFLVMLHFEILYKTEQVVNEKPEVIDSYKKLLSMPDALPIFFDGLFPDSNEFKSAPPESPRGQIWSKLLRRSKNWSEYVFKGINIRTSNHRVFDLARDIIQHKLAVISSYQSSSMVAGAACSASGQFELWKTVLNADPSESEELAGFAVRNSFDSFVKVKIYLRHLVESGTLIHFLDTVDTGVAYKVLFRSPKHISDQKKLCLGYEKAYSDTNDDLHPLGINYYLSFIKLTLALYAVSTVICYLERIYKLTRSIKSCKRRMNF